MIRDIHGLRAMYARAVYERDGASLIDANFVNASVEFYGGIYRWAYRCYTEQNIQDVRRSQQKLGLAVQSSLFALDDDDDDDGPDYPDYDPLTDDHDYEPWVGDDDAPDDDEPDPDPLVD